MSTFTATATVSRKYFMRKTKAWLQVHISDIVKITPADVIEKASLEDDPDWPALFMWFDKLQMSRPYEGFSKHDLATIALRAHLFLPDEK